jgi:hypothetical protein
VGGGGRWVASPPDRRRPVVCVSLRLGWIGAKEEN